MPDPSSPPDWSPIPKSGSAGPAYGRAGGRPSPPIHHSRAGHDPAAPGPTTAPPKSRGAAWNRRRADHSASEPSIPRAHHHHGGGPFLSAQRTKISRTARPALPQETPQCPRRCGLSNEYARSGRSPTSPPLARSSACLATAPTNWHAGTGYRCWCCGPDPATGFRRRDPHRPRRPHRTPHLAPDLIRRPPLSTDHHPTDTRQSDGRLRRYRRGENSSWQTDPSPNAAAAARTAGASVPNAPSCAVAAAGTPPRLVAVPTRASGQCRR